MGEGRLIERESVREIRQRVFVHITVMCLYEKKGVRVCVRMMGVRQTELKWKRILHLKHTKYIAVSILLIYVS